MDFKPIEAKYGYEQLKQIGFYCYKSDGWGDWHRSNSLPDFKVCGSYAGYTLYVKKENSGDYGPCPGHSFVAEGIPTIEALKELIVRCKDGKGLDNQLVLRESRAVL
jgi:hypothetical protein